MFSAKQVIQDKKQTANNGMSLLREYSLEKRVIKPC